MTDKKRCTYKGNVYPHEADICMVEKCMRCNDGEWQALDASTCCWDSPYRQSFGI